jgi:hypothetical protein
MQFLMNQESYYHTSTPIASSRPYRYIVTASFSLNQALIGPVPLPSVGKNFSSLPASRAEPVARTAEAAAVAPGPMRSLACSSAVLLLLLCAIQAAVAQGEWHRGGCVCWAPPQQLLAPTTSIRAPPPSPCICVCPHITSSSPQQHTHSCSPPPHYPFADPLATLQDDPASRSTASCSLFFTVKPSQAAVMCDKVFQTFSLTQKDLEALNPGVKCPPGQPVPRGTLMCVKGRC